MLNGRPAGFGDLVVALFKADEILNQVQDDVFFITARRPCYFNMTAFLLQTTLLFHTVNGILNTLPDGLLL